MKNIASIVVDYQNTFVPEVEGWTWELWVETAWTIAPYINQLTQSVRSKWWLIINTRDSHPVWHLSLASSFKWKRPITEWFALWINPTPESNPEYFLTESEVWSWNEKNNGTTDENSMNIEALKSYIFTVQVQALWPDHAMAWEKSSELLDAYQAESSDCEVIKWHTKEADSYSWFWGIIQTENWDITLNELLQSYRIEIVEIVWVATDYCVWSTAEDSLNNWYETRVHTKWIRWVNSESSKIFLEKLRNNGAKIID